MNEPDGAGDLVRLHAASKPVGIVTTHGRGRRVAAVTLALGVAGAIFGAVASAVACMIWLWSLAQHVDAEALAVAAAVGGVCGAVLGPAGAWLLLRRVPLGVAVLGTTFGAIVGGALGSIIQSRPLESAVAGFLLAGMVLRWCYREQVDERRR